MIRLAVLACLLAGACSRSEEVKETPAKTAEPAPSVVRADAANAWASAADAAPAEPAEGSGRERGTTSGSGFDFDKLDYDDQVAFMKTKVLPVMKAKFQAFDKEKYAEFTCKTCHGKEPQKTKYKMPNPELPKLDFVALKLGKQKPETAKFMDDVVEPEMARILQVPKYSDSNPNGFGCLDCHQMKK